MKHRVTTFWDKESGTWLTRHGTTREPLSCGMFQTKAAAVKYGRELAKRYNAEHFIKNKDPMTLIKAFIDFANCVKAGGHTWSGDDCSKCGAKRDGKTVLEILADDQLSTPYASMKQQGTEQDYKFVLGDSDLPDLELLRKFASGEGGRRTGDLMRRGFVCIEVTNLGRIALSEAEKAAPYGTSLGTCRLCRAAAMTSIGTICRSCCGEEHEDG